VPVTPLHILPTLAVYLLFSKRLHLFAFFSAAFLIDVEPMLYLLFGVPVPTIPLLLGGVSTGVHVVTHNLFGIVVFVAPAATVLAKGLERLRSFWLTVFRGAVWVNRSVKSIYFSALFGAGLHLGWDLTMHQDINLAFPIYSLPNPFVNQQSLDLIWNLSLLTILIVFMLSVIRRQKLFKTVP
jgi:hypothetical protein